MDFTRLTEQINKIKVKNVVDMPLFYGLWCLIVSFLNSVFGKEHWFTVASFVLASFLFFIAGWGYYFFSRSKPEFLRSEDYHLRKQSLDILGDKDNLLPVDSKNIVEIANPYALESPVESKFEKSYE
jgi:hypothetical protein